LAAKAIGGEWGFYALALLDAGSWDEKFWVGRESEKRLKRPLRWRHKDIAPVVLFIAP